MTIHIPVKFLLFVLYTAAVLGGAFGISYAVFEWRHDDEAAASDSGLTFESLDGRIDTLDSRVDGVKRAVDATSSIENSQCHDALKSMLFAGLEALITENYGPALQQDVKEADTAYNLHC